MKTFHPILISIIISFAIFSCQKETNTPTPTHILGLDIQAQFMNDSVKVLFDGKQILNNKYTTNDVLSYAGGIRTMQAEGTHTLKVILNNGISTQQSFNLNKDLYCCINYYSNNDSLFFYLSTIPPVYD